MLVLREGLVAMLDALENLRARGGG